MQENQNEVKYLLKPQGKVLDEYNACREKNSFIMGPLGSSKTTQTILKILDLMCEQEPVKDKKSPLYNVRPSLWFAVRNTYSDLSNTTIRDWMEIHGELGNFKQGGREPPQQKIRFKLDDGTEVHSEIIFVAFDRPDHVRKAKGINCTGIWLNEVSELNKANIDQLDLRHGRFPSPRQGIECTWHGMTGDTNAMSTNHWYYKLAEEVKPKGWAFHRQPGAVIKVGEAWELNPLAENIENLPDSYYLNGLEGKSNDWIKVNFANEYGYVSSGKPIHPRYVDSLHCIDMPFTPLKDLPIVLGFDFGRTPACVFGQQIPPFYRWIIFDEFLSSQKGISATDFAPQLKHHIDANYKGYKFKGWGDPSGGNKGQATDDTPFRIIRASGIPCAPTTTNDPMIRRAAMEEPLKEICMDGKPRFIILPKCKMTRQGLQGGFCYRRIMVSGERYTEEPDKNEFSHPVEAAEYLLQGEGEGRQALDQTQHAKGTAQARTDFNVFG